MGQRMRSIAIRRQASNQDAKGPCIEVLRREGVKFAPAKPQSVAAQFGIRFFKPRDILFMKLRRLWGFYFSDFLLSSQNTSISSSVDW